MAANQTSNQKFKSGSRPQNPQTRRPATSRPEESTKESSSVGEMAHQASDYVSRQASHVTDFAREHTGASVVAALATGFGIGLLIGHALGVPHRQPRRWRDRVAAEGLGRRLLDRIEGIMPEAIAEHFGK